jgi:hypothetical protein
MLCVESISHHLGNLLNEFRRLVVDVEKIAPLFSSGDKDEDMRKCTLFWTQFLGFLAGCSEEFGSLQNRR